MAGLASPPPLFLRHFRARVGTCQERAGLARPGSGQAPASPTTPRRSGESPRAASRCGAGVGAQEQSRGGQTPGPQAAPRGTKRQARPRPPAAPARPGSAARAHGPHAGLGAEAGARLGEPLPAPDTKLLRGSPPHLQHGAPRAFENHRTPLRRARHSPGFPEPPGAAAPAAISSRWPSPRPRCQVTPFTWACSSLPRLRLDPSRRRLRRLRSARLARSLRTASGNSAQPLGESHWRPRRPSAPPPSARPVAA
ncbi:translation initiation factor IF-2-like [Trachypithecus francoisi]|uniref:translation initiation factor IF-2-like n=1 Tax=Trachypithecus francoisi TaxID=54180 RepID=UPI00141AA54B|nr:translation initiation factor IF-2-like [Trachypithecus francoisi]